MLQLVPARTNTEIEPTVRNNIQSRANIRQHCWVTIGIACHHQSNTEPLRQRRKGREQRPSLQAWARHIAYDRHKVVKEPCMLNGRNTIGLLPDPQHIFVGSMLRSRLDTKTQRFSNSHQNLHSLLKIVPYYIRSSGTKPRTRKTLFMVWMVALISKARNAFTCSFVSLRMRGVCS